MNLYPSIDNESPINFFIPLFYFLEIFHVFFGVSSLYATLNFFLDNTYIWG